METEMGTRNLTMVVLDHEARVAQYGQWDGYPEGGQGQTVIDFITEMNDSGGWDEFCDRVRRCAFITGEEKVRRMKATGVRVRDDGLVNVADPQLQAWEKAHPELTRDIGAKVLFTIMASPPLELVDSSTFAADSLFCEYAYVLDLDRMVLEMYTGFQKGPVKGRFADMPAEGQYSPVGLAGEWPLATVTLADLIAADGEDEG